MARKVGILYSGSDLSAKERHPALKKAIERAVKDVVVLDPEWVDNDYGALSYKAENLIKNNPDLEVLVAAGGPVSATAAAVAAAKAGGGVAVVYTAVGDPRGSKLYKAGNVTGIGGMTTELDVARLRLLQELKPKIRRVGVLINKNRPDADKQYNQLAAEADDRLDLYRGDVDRTPGNIGKVIGELVQQKDIQGLLVGADAFFNDKRKEVIASVRDVKIPAVYQWNEFVVDGGLMSYGFVLRELYAVAAKYVVRILNGERASEIPVYQPIKSELFINQKTADALALDIPDSLLEPSRATVIYPR